MQTPTLGRVVIVHGIDPTLNNGATEAPAIITRVWNDTYINVQVLLDAPSPAWMTSLTLFDADAEIPADLLRWATWPARV